MIPTSLYTYDKGYYHMIVGLQSGCLDSDKNTIFQISHFHKVNHNLYRHFVTKQLI